MSANDEHSTKIPLRILFAGGCHVNGYPIGAEFAFPAIALRQLNSQFSCESRHISHLTLSRLELLLAESRSFRPDVLVLQLGHFESGLWLRQRTRKLLNRLLSLTKTPRTMSDSDSMSRGTLPGSLWRVQSWLRIAGDKLLSCAGFPPYALSEFPHHLRRFLAEVRSLSVPHVLVLSPFPCLDRGIMMRRRAMHACLATEAARNNYQFLDMTGDLSDPQPLHASICADAFHLGIEGARRVGTKLASAIRKQVLSAGQTITTRQPLVS